MCRVIDTEAEKQRFAFNMFPKYLFSKMGIEFNSIIKELTTGLYKSPKKQQFQILKVLNDLITTPVNSYINIQDIIFEQEGVLADPYQVLLRIMGVEPTSKLYELSYAEETVQLNLVN